MPEVRLRPATPDDAEAGGALHRRCWAETYGDLADPAVLGPTLADVDGWTRRWEAALADGPPYTLAEDADGALVGFAVAGPARMDDAPTPQELYALYTLRTQHGTGLGDRLLHAVLPDGDCMLWVSEDNHRARAFYARHGFAPDGGRQLYAGLGAWELRLVRPRGA
ncbi:GNAT family N-acetyltransferase [uncultured Nocardioides sp.]|uniref:GNAT family N-acetyltransferase n=1 Tax=uncultured Nocardioides sp. TaxID=198441 RepID=UPI002623FE1B|nr:GNAT family N-acetyltransferase [uncultured Nocardioides sp.]